MQLLPFLTLGLALFQIAGASPRGMQKSKRLFGSPNADFPDPNEDSFYQAPGNVGLSSHGAVLNSREVPTNIDEKYYDKSYQVLYRTQNTAKEADATVATIWTPKTPSKPAKLFSWQVFEDATQLDCNPSWAFINKTGSKNTITTSIDAPSYIQWALQQGYYVVAPDHLGSDSIFIGGYQEGYAILDGIRAAINFNKLDKKTPTALAGYSGGGHATAWAVNLHGSYAPELNIIGAAHGGTPVDPRGIYNFLNGGLFSGFAGAGLSGLARAYKELDAFIQSIVTPEGKKDLAKVASENTCLLQIVAGFPFKNFTAETTAKTDPLNEPIPKRILALESLLSNVSSVGVSVPSFPTFQYHSENDEVVPRDQHEQFIAQQCKAGAKIKYSVLPVADHVTGIVFSIAGTIKALEQIYDGTLDTSQCGGPGIKSEVIRPDSAEAKQILGAGEVRRLSSFNGKQTELGRISW